MKWVFILFFSATAEQGVFTGWWCIELPWLSNMAASCGQILVFLKWALKKRSQEILKQISGSDGCYLIGFSPHWDSGVPSEFEGSQGSSGCFEPAIQQ